MAQMQDVVRGTLISPNTESTAAPAARAQTSDPLTDPATMPQVAAPGALGARSRAMGLRLGERKLLQAVGDCAVIWGGTLLIALFSERGYDAGPILLSLGILMALWVFFANAFDAYNVGVMQAVFRNVY